MNTMSVRESNTALIIGNFLNSEILTQNDIVQLTQLSLPSVGKVIKDCVNNGTLVEVDAGESSGGRKPRQYSLSKKKFLTAILFIEKHKSYVYVLTPFKDVIYQKELHQVISDNSTFQSIVETLVNTMKAEFEDASFIETWGLILPGILNLETNTIVYSKRLGIIDFDFNYKVLGCEEENNIFLFQDSDAYLISSISDDENKRCAMIYVNDGLGFSLISNQALQKRFVGSLELGHTVFYDSQNKLVKIGDVFSNKNLEKVFSKAEVSSEEGRLSKLRVSENEAVREIAKTQINALRISVINVINLFNPDLIFLSGDYLKGLELTSTIHDLNNSVLPPYLSNVTIKHSERDKVDVVKGIAKYVNQIIMKRGVLR